LSIFSFSPKYLEQSFLLKILTNKDDVSEEEASEEEQQTEHRGEELEEESEEERDQEQSIFETDYQFHYSNIT
jgi:hypothetical protein